eukprot:Platyproteum_vivax@DN4303_c0_g1_i1.p1
MAEGKTIVKATMFSTRSYDREWFDKMNTKKSVQITYQDCRLTKDTVVLAEGSCCVICFVNDELDRSILEMLHKIKVRCIALRCAGFNKVDLDAANELKMTVVRVPAYSPESVAEHAIALMQTLNRRIHKAYARTRDGNFALEGLVGQCLHGKTVGVVGTGKIGLCAMAILKGYGVKILAYDIFLSDVAKQMGAEYVTLEELVARSDFITLHCPLTPENYHLFGKEAFAKMKPGCTLVNTSRGALVSAAAALDALKAGILTGLAMDVYEEEDKLFFDDHSNEVITDDLYRQLSACYNVIFTGHQAFLTREALEQIASVTFANLSSYFSGKQSGNEVTDVVHVSIGALNRRRSSVWKDIEERKEGVVSMK